MNSTHLKQLARVVSTSAGCKLQAATRKLQLATPPSSPTPLQQSANFALIRLERARGIASSAELKTHTHKSRASRWRRGGPFGGCLSKPTRRPWPTPPPPPPLPTQLNNAENNNNNNTIATTTTYRRHDGARQPTLSAKRAGKRRAQQSSDFCASKLLPDFGADSGPSQSLGGKRRVNINNSATQHNAALNSAKR